MPWQGQKIDAAPDESVTRARVVQYTTVAETVCAFGQFCQRATPPLFPIFSGVDRTGYCHGPWLQASEAPLERTSAQSTESPHQCSHLSLMHADVKTQMRARTLLADPAAFPDRARKFFAAEGSTHDRLRSSNRRRGITSSQELLIGDWLFTTGSHASVTDSQYLTIERFRGDTRLASETVTIYKSVCVREADGQWRLMSEYGRKDVVDLEGLAESEVCRMAAKVGMTCTFA